MQQAVLKRTPLSQHHAEQGAKLVDFAGWEMPLQFTRVLEEHHAVRTAAGLFDIAHMGVLSVTSGDATATIEALNALVPQDLPKLYPGKAFYTQLLNERGGIIDDIILYWMPSSLADFPGLDEVMVIANAANTQKVMDWLEHHLPKTVQVAWLNGRYCLTALQGPQFKAVLNASGLQPADAPLPKRFHIGRYVLNGQPVLLSRTGYTGEDGVEILVAADRAVWLWETLLQQGQPFGLKPIGLAARDTLRLEAAYPLHGAELTEDITPLEAGLDWSVKLDQPAEFIGKSALLAQRAQGLSRHFVCFEIRERAIPRHHDLIYDESGQPVGDVTSGSISPTLDRPIGVGYVQKGEPLLPGTPLKIGIRGKQIEAVVVKRPFYQREERG